MAKTAKNRLKLRTKTFFENHYIGFADFMKIKNQKFQIEVKVRSEQGKMTTFGSFYLIKSIYYLRFAPASHL